MSPQRRRILLIRVAGCQVAQEGALTGATGALADRCVQQAPIDAEAEPADDVLERLLVEMRDLGAQFNEVGATHRNGAVIFGDVASERWLIVRDVRQRRVAANTGDVLYPAFSGQAVVVPADRIEDRLAAHALIARNEIGVRVTEHVADVEAATHRWRRRVDRKHVIARG